MFRKIFCLFAVLVILPTFTANAATELSSFSVFATNSVWILRRTDVNSGNIGVADASPGPWLNSEVEVTIGHGDNIADGVSIYGDSIKIKTRASAFDIYYNELTNNGTIRGSEYTPLILPLDITMPVFPTPAPGTEDHDIPPGGSLTLNAGSYGEILVRKKATLTLTGGTYHFEDLDLANRSKVLFQAPTELIINNRLGAGKNAVIGPEDGSGISAKNIRIYVNGIDGSTGNLDAKPQAARIGYDNILHANIYAPNGTVWIKHGTVADGAFIGKDVKIGYDAQVTLNSGFLGVVLPPDPGEEGKLTLLGVDSDEDGVRDDIQRYIYFTYPDDEKLQLGLTYYAKEFQGVLADANDREAAYNHAVKMARHGECLFHIKGRGSINICRALRAEILNTRERSIAYITYSDNLGGRVIRGAPRDEWKDSCSFDVDATGGDQ